MKKLIIYMVICLALSGAVYAEEEISVLYDDCVDFSKAVEYSENLFAYTVPEEDYYAYDTDYTMFRRTANTKEWLTYKADSLIYPVFYTYFRYTDNIPHFQFMESADGENWTEIKPAMKIKEVEDWKWIPVEYSLNNLNENSKLVKIIYSDKSEYEWSPMISGVEYRNKIAEGFFDCKGMECEASVNKLYALGFVDGYNEYEFRPENNVTRAEFAKLNAGILGLPVSGRAEQVFNDVPSDYWAAAPISSLYRMGVINGDENKNFNPESSVTYAEAEKMFAVSLGYSVFAESNGGYPSGYSLVANRLKLNNDISQEDKNADLTRGDMAIMMDNVLSAELIYQTSFGSNAEFEKSDKTLLDVYFDIKQVEGIVNSSNGMGITEEILRKIDLAYIDGEKYDTDIDITHLLGMNVRAYIKDDKLLYAEKHNSDIIEISADDFVCIDKDEFIYNTKNGEKSIKISDNTRIIVNGEYKTRVGINSDLDGISGFIKLIKNHSKAVDTILVESYENYISAGDFMLTDVITVKGSQSIKLDLDKGVNLRVSVYGEETDYREAKVRKNDVIYLAKSESGDIVNVIISNNSYEGDVTYRDDETVTVEGKEYKLADSYSAINGELSAGSISIIYTDINGSIFTSESVASFQYAYLCNTAEADSFGGSVSLRLINKDGEVIEVKADDKTSLNGSKKSVSTIENIQPQLVRVRLENDTLKAIETAAESFGNVGNREFALNYKSDASKYYGGNISAFGSIYQVGAATPVFVIPENEGDIKEYKVSDRGIFLTDKDYKVDIYDMSDEYRAGAVVVNMAESSKRLVEPYDNVAVVRKSSVITNADGDRCLKLYVYIKGEEREVYFDNLGGEDNTGSWLPSYESRDTKDGNNVFSPGEVIQYYSDSESHCKSFRMLLTDEIIDNNILYENNTGDYGNITDEKYFSELYTAFGTVKERFSDKLLISAYSDGRRVRTIPTAGSAVYTFNVNKNELKTGDMFDVSIGRNVFVRMNYDSTTDIIVVENE